MNGFDILDEFSNEELSILVEIIIKKGDLTEELSSNSKYQQYAPDHKQYIDVIKDELSRYAGNSFANLVRGYGVSYREMLIDVCKETKTPFNEDSSLERIENSLLEKVLMDTWENLSEEKRQEILGQIPGMKWEGVSTAALITIFRAGGFTSYQLLVIFANTVAKALVGRGLSVLANAALTRTFSILTGPIGMSLTALYTVLTFAGPAYRVTAPATIYIASLRQIHQSKYFKDLLASQ